VIVYSFNPNKEEASGEKESRNDEEHTTNSEDASIEK